MAVNHNLVLVHLFGDCSAQATLLERPTKFHCTSEARANDDYDCLG
jgi:hypothetical protein